MKRLLLLILSLSVLSIFAQQETLNPVPLSMEEVHSSNPAGNTRECGLTIALRQLEKQGKLEAYQKWHKAFVQDFQERKAELMSRATNTVYQVPVVVHIVHNGTPAQNVTDAQVATMLENLNKDYARTNDDASQTRPMFQGVASSVDLQFCLARTDPNGLATTGIVRKQTSHGHFNPGGAAPNAEDIKYTAQGGDDAWPTDKYLNIWIGDLTQGTGTGIMGYSTLAAPGVPGQPDDGFIMDCVGVAAGSLDRTPTHEIGHYFGLFHPWGQGGTGSCTDDDGINDTPTTDLNHLGGSCTDTYFRCGSEDQFENFMGYSNCTNMFTTEQAAFMKNALETIRAELVNGTRCELPVLTADFTPGTVQNINTGDQITFTDASSGPGTIATWEWEFEGGTPATATGQGPHTITYNTAGTFKVHLKVTDGSGSDEEEKADHVTVTSVLNANFSASAINVPINEDITFTDLSTGPDPITSWKWEFGDGSSDVTVPGPVTHAYANVGTYTVKLTVEDGTSSDSKEMQVEAYDPNALNIIDFTGTPTEINVNENVTFDLECNIADNLIDSIRWIIPGTDDGSNNATYLKTNTNPFAVQYTSGGIFPVEVRVYRTYGTDGDTLIKQNYIKVLSPENTPVANFHANPISGPVGTNINFYTDVTPEMEIDSVKWVIQNGAADYTPDVFNPANQPFNLPGDFDVKLTVYSKFGIHDTTKTNYIHIFNADDFGNVTANFTATSSRLIKVGEGVQLVDLSEGNITNRYWRASAGATHVNSTESEPKLMFAEAGIYDVRLIVFSGIHHTDTLTKENYIVVTTSDWYQENGDYCDTLSNILPSERVLSYRKAAYPSWGYFPGHYAKVSESGTEKTIKRYAEKFNSYTPDYIENILLPVARAHAGDNDATIQILFWEGNQYGRPDHLIENSSTRVKINSLQEGVFNRIKLKNKVKADSTFFVGFKLSYGSSVSPQDTFAISMSPSRSTPETNTLYISPSSTDNTKWFKPTEFLGFGLNVSTGIKLIGCIVNVPELEEIDSKMSVFPNPASNKIFVKFDELQIDQIDIEVFDILGKKIKANFTHRGNNKYEVDMNKAENGFYLIHTKVNNYSITKKVLIHK